MYPNPGEAHSVTCPPDVLATSASAEFVARVHQWLAAGLAVSGSVAIWVQGRPELRRAFGAAPAVFLPAFLVVAMAVMLERRVVTLSASAGATALVAFSTAMGVASAAAFGRYLDGSVAMAFLVPAAAFALSSVVGHLTGRELSGWRGLAVSATTGFTLLGAAMMVAPAVRAHAPSWVATGAGVAIFSALAAHHTRRRTAGPGGNRLAAVVAALSLYMDFVNVFSHLLRALRSGLRRVGVLGV